MAGCLRGGCEGQLHNIEHVIQGSHTNTQIEHLNCTIILALWETGMDGWIDCSGRITRISGDADGVVSGTRAARRGNGGCAGWIIVCGCGLVGSGS